MRIVLASLVVTILAFATTWHWGFYDDIAFVAVMIAWVFALTLCSLRRRKALASIRETRFSTWLLALVALGLSGAGIPCAEGLWTNSTFSIEKLLPWVAFVGFVVTASLVTPLLFPSVKVPGLFAVPVLLLFLTGGLLRVAAVLAAPNPGIDVYTALRDAPDHLLQGHNPYTGSYEWPYPYPQTEKDRFPFYPPLPILFGVPFRAVGLDVRFASVLCDLLAAGVMLEVGRGRGNALRGAFTAAAYLFFPRTPFMIEQAWFEPMLALLLGSGLLLVERGRWAGYFLLGLGLTGKQYGLVLLIPLLRSLWRRRLALTLGVAGAMIVVILPFLLWNPKAFLEVVVWAHLSRPPREDALTIHSGASSLLGIQLSSAVLQAPAWLLIGWIGWRTPEKTVAAAFWMGTALLTFCLFFMQAFFNYFYLCEYLFLLGMIGMTEEPAGGRVKPVEEHAR